MTTGTVRLSQRWRPPPALERIGVLVRKEFRQVFRDPRMLRVIFVAPVVQLIVFGYAVSTDVRHTRTFVVDHDRSAASRALVDVFAASGYFDIVGGSPHPEDLVRALEHGKVTVGLEIPVGFAADLRSPQGTEVQLVLDGTNSNTATVAQGYAERILQAWGVRTAGAAGRMPVDLRARAWYNPDLASRNYNVPAVVGVIMMLVCLLLTALAVVREREIGTLEQLMVSPLRPLELVVGKSLPFGIVGLIDVVVISSVARLWFHVPFTGNPWLLLGASVLYLGSGLGLGLLLSTVSKTQQEAFLASFLFFMPIMLLSGFLFPVQSMPAVFQWLTMLNPVRHYLEIVRGIFLKDAGVVDLWRQLLTLFVLGVGLLSLAASRFRKTLA
ncbi:MAG TPA: ABC transporter permease [Candidatus Krumholzibacteria bacterium]|nr:ABC transporter permease [Candidatus Krumholzibacteria bacterium]